MSSSALVYTNCLRIHYHFPEWKQALFQHPRVNGNAWLIVGVSLILFPKLALGLSGFETGVAVMPLVKGDEDLSEEDWEDIHSTQNRSACRDHRLNICSKDESETLARLLRTAALIMSVFLITSSLVTTTLIPAEKFQEGGEANGRAIAYLAHHFFGDIFGTVTISARSRFSGLPARLRWPDC